jgi:hypothetical protein
MSTYEETKENLLNIIFTKDYISSSKKKLDFLRSCYLVSQNIKISSYEKKKK